jgi:hypothetical protein
MDQQHVDRAPLIDQLQKVADAAQPLPASLSVSGRAEKPAGMRGGDPILLSVGGEVKAQVLRIVFSAINELRMRDEKEASIRASAVAMLAKTEADIEQLERENAAAEAATS